MSFNIIKLIYNKPTTNTTLKGKKPIFSSKVKNKTRIPTLAISIQYILEMLARAIRQREREMKKGMKGGREGGREGGRKKRRKKERVIHQKGKSKLFCL